MAERIVDDILSSNSEILSAGVIDKRGDITANKSSESFEKRFKGVRNLERNKYGGTLAVAALSIANEVKEAFGESQALITIYRDCKLVLLPMPLYDILIGLAYFSTNSTDGRLAPLNNMIAVYLNEEQPNEQARVTFFEWKGGNGGASSVASSDNNNTGAAAGATAAGG